MDLFFIISKFFLHFILPPGVFILLFVFAGVLVKRYKSLFFIMALLTYLTSTEYFYDKLLLNRVDVKSYDFNSSFDAVVVLGLGVDENSPSFELPPEAFRNFMYAIYLGYENNVPIIFSGKGTSVLSESEVANRTLDKISKIYNKRPNINIIFEDRSRNTFENAKFTKEILKKMGLENKKVALVTSVGHIPRAYRAFEGEGISCVVRASANFTKENFERKKYSFFSFVPKIWYLFASHRVIKEFFGNIALYIESFI